MGLSGLEPPTSRLSGVRSNRLSYKPVLRFVVTRQLDSQTFGLAHHVLRTSHLKSNFLIRASTIRRLL